MRSPSSAHSPWPIPALREWAGGVTAFLVLLSLAGCGPRVVLMDRGPQAYYQTGFPVHDVSRDLERAFRSLRRVEFTSEYDTYIFSEDAGVTEGDLADPAVLDLAVESFSESHSKAGTAVVVSRSDRRVVLVTNNHVVTSAPVLIHHFDEDRTLTPLASRRVASVSVRTREWGLLAEHPALGIFDVIARDTVDDIAAIEVRLPRAATVESFTPLAATPGDPRRLSWGSFVYVLGFPSGYRMVSRAIVSDPDRDRKGSFLTDGLWNEGISGGIILAVRGEDGRLEWVGITRASAGTQEIRLQPAGHELPVEQIGILYDGPIYAEATLRIQYGITLSVPMTAVREFVDRHRSMLHRRGYDVRRF